MLEHTGLDYTRTKNKLFSLLGLSGAKDTSGIAHVTSARKTEKTTGKRRNINEIIKLLPAWKEELTDKDTGEHWLRSTDATSLQQTLRDLDKAYKNHATNPAHFNTPKHKKKNTGRQSYKTTNITITDKTHVHLPKIGKVKAKISQPVIGRLTSAYDHKNPQRKVLHQHRCARRANQDYATW